MPNGCVRVCGAHVALSLSHFGRCMCTLQEMYLDAFTLPQFYKTMNDSSFFSLLFKLSLSIQICVCLFFLLLHHIRFIWEKEDEKSDRRKKMRTDESNSESNISFTAMHTQYSGGIATGTNDSNTHTHTHTVFVHSMHYSCLIVRLNPIIQRVKRVWEWKQEKESRERKIEMQIQSHFSYSWNNLWMVLAERHATITTAMNTLNRNRNGANETRRTFNA